jgi:hypothetical protein
MIRKSVFWKASRLSQVASEKEGKSLFLIPPQGGGFGVELIS